MATAQITSSHNVDTKEYNRRIWAWTMYDWANSAFATTILAAVLPVYFSQVAGATLPSATVATSYWSTGLSISLLIIAVFSPILGTISDIQRGKKKFLAVFAGIGILSTALLVFVSTGDWVLAAILGVIGRIGFSGANVFYDALLPHVAKREDRDRVSTRGYAMGYLGGGLLLAVNVAMIQFLPGTWGPRLSFLSVAIWWAVFSIPLFRRIPEPPAASIQRAEGVNVLSASFQRLKETFLDIRQYRELFKFLLAFLIYNDGIGTIIGVAAIYGAELGFGDVELILALLLVQFVGIPYSLIFGRLPNPSDRKRSFYLAFIVFNLIALPILGRTALSVLPAEISGAMPDPYPSTATALGQGFYSADEPGIQLDGTWEESFIPASELGTETDVLYVSTNEVGAGYVFPFNGKQVQITFSQGPSHGIYQVYIDDQSLTDPDSGEPVILDAYNPTIRYAVTETFQVDVAAEHALRLVNSPDKNPNSQGNMMTLGGIEVLPARPQSNLLVVLMLIMAVVGICLVLALLVGKFLFSRLAQTMDTKRSIILALIVYTVIAIWGFLLNSVVEFWALAWMVAIVQGGSQALSRSLYSAMSPAAKSGEFFGLFGIMEKFSTIIGPLVFAAAGLMFGSSRPAVLSLIAFFAIGGTLLLFVNVDEGKRVAEQEDEQLLGDLPDTG